MAPSMGIYVSVPFCKAKCTFCNFASAAFPPQHMQRYVEQLCREIDGAQSFALRHQLQIPPAANTVFFGGGTPTLLSPPQLRSIFEALRRTFIITPNAEVTVEAAPGQIGDDVLDTLVELGVNRVSFGVQSFIDAESRAVGRLHTAAEVIAEIDRVRAQGLSNISLDLIAGLPHQTATSWQVSLQRAIETSVDHISVYMLEVDEDSRLGRELIGPGARYGASATPDEALTTELYRQACETLEKAGLLQYEISNFARPGHQSRHNRKYWEREPYRGFGLDAPSMLHSLNTPVRFANTDDLDTYLAGDVRNSQDLDRIDPLAVFEETIFLGLRLREGLSIAHLRREHPPLLFEPLLETIRALSSEGLMRVDGDRITLTSRGRLVSSSVFGELLAQPA